MNSSKAKKISTFLSSVFFILYSSGISAQIIRYVDSASNITGSGGTSWATASNDFQATINASNAGDQVWVKKGTYLPASAASFSMKEAVAIYGGFAGNETVLNQRNYVVNKTILKGNGNRVIYNYYPFLTNASVIDGFTVTGGNSSAFFSSDGAGMYNYKSSPVIANCIFSNNYAGNGDGGGMYNYNNAPVITNCTFTNNSVINQNGRSGGAMHNEFSASPIISNCTFSYNSAASGNGGAIYNESSCSPVISNCIFNNNASNFGAAMGFYGTGTSPSISNCIFKNNTATTSGGAIYSSYSAAPAASNCVFSFNTAQYGGALYAYAAAPVINNCIFNKNSANAVNNFSYGGAVYYSSVTASAVITSCIFSYNTSAGSSSYGAAIYNLSSSPGIRNCIFSNNTATYTIAGGSFGGAICNSGSSPSINNCTFSNNSASGIYGFGGGIYNYSSSSPVIVNSVLFGDTGTEIYNSSSTAAVSYSTIQGGYAGTGNINTAPLFLNTANPIGPDSIWGTADDGLRLFICSPAVNSGNNAAVPVAMTTDFAGAARIQQTIVDMGAYEGGEIKTTTWLGLSGNWADAANWSDGAVPNTCCHVIISSGTPFMPQVSGSEACYKLTVNSGAVITFITGSHLLVAGK